MVGPRGCGKSTFMKLMSGLLRADQNLVVPTYQKGTRPFRTCGHGFSELCGASLAKDFQRYIASVRDRPTLLRKFKSKSICSCKKAKEILSSVRFEYVAEMHPWELSGCIRQRASLSRTLIYDPKMLVLDGPFGALIALPE